LNICAVLSQLNKHQEAQVNAMNSIILIQDEMLKEALPLLMAKKAEEKEEENNPESQAFNTADKKKKNTIEERITILSIAYHNLAVELEYLHKHEDCLKVYEKAYEFSSSHLGPDKQVTKNLKNVLQSAKNQIKSKKDKKANSVTNSKMKKSTASDKMRKTALINSHPYSDTKEMTDNKFKTQSKMGKTMGGTQGAFTKTAPQKNDEKYAKL